MRSRNVAVLAGLLSVALLASTGCVTKKLFRRNVQETDTRVTAVESGVEANERRVKDLRTETDSKITDVDSKAEQAVEVGRSAMTKAEQAIRGRLIWEVTLSDDRVKFSFNQATIPPDAKAVLDDLVSKIKNYDKAVYIEIEGHTDSAGSDDYNYGLGLKRAQTVYNYLASQGIPLHAMNVVSFGESRPVTDNANSSGRAQNRRVVVRVLE